MSSDQGSPRREAAAPHDPVTVEATVAHVLFANQDSGWTVLRCRSDEGTSLTAVGSLLGTRKGDRLRLTGQWITHPKFGCQLEVSSYVHVHPTTLEGIRKYLGAGRIRGIGPTMAERLVEAFGLETIAVIEHHPERLLEVRGIGPKTLDRLQESWVGQRGVQQIMVFLSGHGVTPGVAHRVLKRYGAAALEAVRSNPYRLADEVIGVGFLTADRMALSLGLPIDSEERQEAGLLYALQQAAGDGHVFLPRDRLLDSAAALLRLEDHDLSRALERLVQREQVVIRARADAEPAVYTPALERAESSVARAVRALLAAKSDPLGSRVDQELEWFQRQSQIQLAQQQRAALASALTENLVIITGGPGTGKTTLIRGLTQILARQDRELLLAAPTGRAAKRLQEATGHPARTIHRLLEFSPVTRDFGRDRQRPLEGELVVVDEVSMLDVELAAHLLEALPPRCRLVLVGDADQLPSVGPGNVLADLIASARVPVTRLTEIFRQAADSQIVVNAHRVNRGEMPIYRDEPGLQDFYFVERDDPEAAARLAVELVTERIPRRFGLDPIDDVQLLSPMHRGELGVANLNQRLQEVLVPPGPELVLGRRRLRAGDKVMQVRNNYELEIFNGDIGRVATVDLDDRSLTATFDGRLLAFDTEDLEDLVPAFACTIHKSQGSEYPAVVVLLHHQHHIMLQRNLLYTAITRGKKLVTIIGSRRALRRAVTNATVRQRYTTLDERLS